MIHDPVCGMEIKDIVKAEKAEYEGKIYYFCSTHCKTQFEHYPDKYAKKDDGHKHHHH